MIKKYTATIFRPNLAEATFKLTVYNDDKYSASVGMDAEYTGVVAFDRR